MDNWLGKLSAWLFGLVQSIFWALVDWLHDGALWVFDSVLQAIAGLVASIPAPSFMQSGVSLGSLLSGFPPYTFYLLSHLRLGDAFAIFSAGVAFRLARKFLTLFQW